MPQELPLLLIKPSLLPMKRQELEKVEEHFAQGLFLELDMYLLLSEVKRLRKTYEP
jgi:hypothetical protein